ncbi:hypothetical protein Gohar_006969 [Gossypium harknessii]|uniref:Reverse transcriptase zinc-binding domain-containing protein n=2 Tax=Gossypium harknessii TaxID=34285 RepID=A0A7J9GF27_9ROSI|nr:hypothetical protein [Gossypium harknessii]
MKGLKWNLDLFLIWLPDEVINRIVSVPPPHPDSGSNRVIWARSALGSSVRRIGYISSCPICGHGFEDIVHVLRDCLIAKEVLLHVIPSEQHQSWAQQFKFHQSGYKINKYNPIHNFQDNSLWVQLYIDGAVVRDTRNAFAGGMLQDQCRNWILGFNRYLGKCLPFEAE